VRDGKDVEDVKDVTCTCKSRRPFDELGKGHVAVFPCDVCCRPSPRIGDVGIDARVEKEFGDVHISVYGRMMKRGPSVVVLCVEIQMTSRLVPMVANGLLVHTHTSVLSNDFKVQRSIRLGTP